MPPAKTDYRSLVLVGIVLPALLALADQYLLTGMSGATLSPAVTALIFGFYVCQIALMSWAVARFIERWPLRWIILIWAMMLIDLQLAAMSGQERNYLQHACLSTGVLAGQFGAVIVWGVLGSGHIKWRIPALLVLVWIGWNFFQGLIRLNAGALWIQLGWEDLFMVQSVVLATLCGAMRLAGYSLLLAPNEIQDAAEADGRRLQFGIGDVLIGTTALATLLGIAKAGDLLTWRFAQSLHATSFWFVALVAILTAAVLLVALWAALGRGPALLRGLVLVLVPLAAAFPVVWYCINVGRPQMLANRDYRLFHWFATGYWWIGWMFLAATLLAASLIVFRTLGYRLVRSRVVARSRVAVMSKAVASGHEVVAAAD
jgi:hypothetical protein